MAIWQFKLFFAPERALISKFGVLPSMASRDLMDESLWWNDIQPPTGFEEWIDTVLPRAEPWSESMQLWGEKYGDEANVFYTDDSKKRVEEISFELDVRELSYSLVRSICKLAKRMKCVFVTGACRVLVPDETLVLEAIENSRANQYLSDPVSTLLDMKQKGECPTLGEVVEEINPTAPNDDRKKTPAPAATKRKRFWLF